MRLIDADKIGLTDFEIVMCNGDYKKALKMLLDKISNQPTAYDICKVVKELESFAKLAENRYKNNTSTHALQEHRCWVKAIEIVKQGGTGKDVV